MPGNRKNDPKSQSQDDQLQEDGGMNESGMQGGKGGQTDVTDMGQVEELDQETEEGTTDEI